MNGAITAQGLASADDAAGVMLLFVAAALIAIVVCVIGYARSIASSKRAGSDTLHRSAPVRPSPARTSGSDTPTQQPKQDLTVEVRDRPTGAVPSSGIFISYRRQDEPNFAGRLSDRLTQHFGSSHVFMDVDSIELGLDFADVINGYLAKCEVLIAVIGKGWLNAADAQGRRRLDNVSDYVRLEVEAALTRRIRVIPVIVEGAQVPQAEELPRSLESLARRNGIEMSHANFGSDTAKLIATLDRIISQSPP